jgi:hypothetical protein
MISNEKANLLFSLEKQTKDNSIELPNPNEIVSIELQSVDEHYQSELFSLDINRKYISLSKKTLQKRVQQNIVLRRLDFNAGHRNPTIVSVPQNINKNLVELMQKYENVKFSKESHIHIYIEGYGEKWAFPLSEFDIVHSDNLIEQTKEFCKYCNIINEITFNQKDLLCMP